ncbi:MAG: GWxTD domain-containing protein [Candidatus Aminicenantes bacterium]|nr:GWxTD domain-containing protein [Candidatus Aminicenantes bacterium]
MMTKRLFILFIILSLSSPLLALQKNSTKDLPLKYNKWLEEDVFYIISPVEKEVFLQLNSDRERDLFIKAFWKQRDPTPGTPENEFQTEHYSRINYANSNFGRGISKPGWDTPRGEYYIILGEPHGIERFSGGGAVHETEVWFYQGLTELGLPTAFNLIFFQERGIGEHVLYNPLAHGPQALMTSYKGDQTNYLAAYKELKKIDPVLAKTSMSLIPGEPTPYGQPSLSSNILIQNVQTAPQKMIKDLYAKKFLEYKDIVEVDYSANYIDNDSSVKIIQDPSGIYFVHYVIELTKFSILEYDNRYSTHLKINGNISDQDGKTVFQYEGSFDVNLDETGIKKIGNKPFNLYDMFPLVPGDYKLSVILKNEVSKEFTSFERNIFIPEEIGDSKVRMGQLILGYKMDRIVSEPHKKSPFQVGLDQIYHQPNRVFHPQEKLFVVFQIKGLTSKLSERGQIKYEFYKGEELFLIESREVSTLNEGLNFKEGFPRKIFGPAHYKVKVSLWLGDREITSQSEEFDITSVAAIPRPWIYSREQPSASDPVYAFILGKQHFNKGEIGQARIKYETAISKNPDWQDCALELAKVYMISREYKKANDMLLPFSKTEEIPYQASYLLGKSYQALGEYIQAIDTYNKAVSHFGMDVNLLNSLGECYFSLGMNEEALAAWNASLEIKPKQPDIKQKLESIKK